MTNFEKYKDEIMDISIKGRRVALVKRQPVDCHNISCTACDLYCEVPCDVERLKWLYEEYKEPAPTLTSKERAFCEEDDNEVYASCPVCSHTFVYDTLYDENWSLDYCPDCGQSLKWEDRLI